MSLAWLRHVMLTVVADDQVEALTRQVETAADPVSMKYAQDARDEYLRAHDSKANPKVDNENLESGSIIAEIEKIVQRELHRTAEAASVTVTVFKPSRYSWATGFKTDASHAVHGIPGTPSGGMLVTWRSSPQSDSDEPPF